MNDRAALDKVFKVSDLRPGDLLQYSAYGSYQKGLYTVIGVGPGHDPDVFMFNCEPHNNLKRFFTLRGCSDEPIFSGQISTDPGGWHLVQQVPKETEKGHA